MRKRNYGARALIRIRGIVSKSPSLITSVICPLFSFICFRRFQVSAEKKVSGVRFQVSAMKGENRIKKTEDSRQMLEK
jgi:hypothetical protein